jgi:hypothetical protein
MTRQDPKLLEDQLWDFVYVYGEEVERSALERRRLGRDWRASAVVLHGAPGLLSVTERAP